MARRVIEKSKSPQGKELKDNDRVMFNFSTKKFSHPLQSGKFTVAEIANDTTRFEGYMQTLASQLNSNESFDIDDEFQVDMTIITEPDAGGRTNLSILGKLNMTTVLLKKRCVLPIKNSEDSLCLARAICLTKAWFHKDDDRESLNHYKNLRDYPISLTRSAKYQHREAGVPEGACGREELQKFQEYLAPDYRLKTQREESVITTVAPPMPHSSRGATFVILATVDLIPTNSVTIAVKAEDVEPAKPSSVALNSITLPYFAPTVTGISMTIPAWHSIVTRVCVRLGFVVECAVMNSSHTRKNRIAATGYVWYPRVEKRFLPPQVPYPENQNYIGPLPAAEYYDPDGMSEKKKKEFEAWYAEESNKNLHFDLKYELVAYCGSDVALLKAGCLKFIDEFNAIAKSDPMEKCVTIAQACNRYWRKYVMAPDYIAIEPENGWEGAAPNHSHVALEWLTWTKRSLGTRIQHARQGGEFSIPHGSRVYTVDGYDRESRTIYEFHGCLFHGCRDCFPKRNQVAFASAGLNVEALRRQTAQKTATLQQLGYTVVEMWQCQWEKQKKADPILRNFLQSLNSTTPLQPREAFFGGRTGATTFYHRIDPNQGEQIRYADVTSEYPWVNKYGEYPIGHPTIYLEPFNQDPYAYYGLMKVSILPPTDLFSPVLPHRQKIGSAFKLTFPLCRSCVGEESVKPMEERNYVCPHTDEDVNRGAKGTYPFPRVGGSVAKRDDQDPEKGRATNVFIAAFTTCQARLKLYESLEILKERVLCYDTDSVVYKWKPGESEIPLGDYLGDMTNELEDGDYIVEFISAGAKNYGYVTVKGESCVKVKGFSLNVRGMLQLNYDIMKSNILDEIQHPLDESRKTEIINPVHFVRDPVKKKIRTETQIKAYRLVFDKRVMENGTFSSLPYGYARLDEEDTELAHF
ncbi:hypothetical protein AWC38_SpisGene8231 [Stylophora pistillata]|uniref:DNA-directed DNA polymerase n=1 Tax=Stylophora pistillata TaxID=50429 RepID=A0A2B4SER6_STYPI|nr:hypothetical protein AWC38_SpisGene8231 [Stylophora pistillata]